jgi:hypothetical protein
VRLLQRLWTVEGEGGAAEFPLVLGRDMFGDRTHDKVGRPESHAQTIRNVVEEGVLADQVSVDFFGIGDHHTQASRCPRPTCRLVGSDARTGSGACMVGVLFVFI